MKETGDQSQMDYNIRQMLADIKIVKMSSNRFALDGIEDKEFWLNKRELYIMLHNLCGTEPEEIAFMLWDIKEDPKIKYSYFGMNGTYLFSK